MAAFVAQNQQRGLSHTIAPQPVDGELLLDVRTPQEFANGTVRGAINIPVDELRSRLSELDKDRPIHVLCQVGLRGYIAERILRQHGYAARNVKGGYLLARNMVPCTPNT
ncbi:MAG TPA: rhodanese-like domain-containing protein [Tepidisphaeraceae bacterium]|nr:rhodanese-like domain-containing protein [Tepidisphaeraceae bacterium]